MNASEQFWTAVTTIVLAVIGLAAFAALFSNGGQSFANVATSGGNAITNMIGAALRPLNGGTLGNLNMPSVGAMGGGYGWN